ncbi:MAG: trypsin-like peptidase domain-containing protein [Pirellulales bacterium]|nr:trypsin-like peptidase domain-containing protein [Pirellulales bacterium]
MTQTSIHPYDVRMPRRSKTLVVVFAVLVILISLPYLTNQIWYAAERGRERARIEALRDAKETQAEDAKELLKDLPVNEGIIPLVAKSIDPSVVGIEAVRAQTVLVPIGMGAYQPRNVPSQGKASGVLIGGSGYIVTNYHVIEGAKLINVQLSDGRMIEEVEIVGVDPPSDLAVLKIYAPNLKSAEWGDSSELEVGDPVIAVGNPFGLMRTVTSGIISAKGRKKVIERLDNQDFLQTDAAVNPGNSGGPLVDMKGQVVGINTAIVGQTYRGISFAIPSRIAKEITEHLIKEGAVPRGWLGAEPYPLDVYLAERLGLESTDGVLIWRIVPGSPADKAGIVPGDVITRWNGQPIDTPHDLHLAVGQNEIGSIAKVTLIRRGQTRQIEVEIAKRPTGVR